MDGWIAIVLSLRAGGSAGKESACGAGGLGSIPGSGRSPGGGHGSPLHYSCLENSHGERSLAGYTPWDLKKSDTTEQPTASLFTSLPPSTSLKKQLGGFCLRPTPPPYRRSLWASVLFRSAEPGGRNVTPLGPGEERARLRRLKAYLLRC